MTIDRNIITTDKTGKNWPHTAQKLTSTTQKRWAESNDQRSAPHPNDKTTMNIAVPSRSNIVTMQNTNEDSLLERTVTPKPTSSTTSSTDQGLSSCVNVQSKTEYYDNDRILSKWGFSDNICHCCEKKNSDLHGLLMQCAKCKKAYYCSMKVCALRRVA